MKRFIYFTTICIAISFLAAGLFRMTGGQYNSLLGTLFASLYMFFPMISVIITQLVFKEKIFKGTGISFLFNKWWIPAFLIMPVFTVAATFGSALIPGIEIDTNNQYITAYLNQMSGVGGPWGLLIVLIGIGIITGATINALFAFGEEIAWRGYLPKVLGDIGFWKKSLLIGFVWGLWHAPLILMGHNYPDHPIAGVGMMILVCISLTPVLLFIREKSGSMITSAILHGSLNALAGLSVAYLSQQKDLLSGCCGVVGISILVIFDIIIAVIRSKSEQIIQ